MASTMQVWETYERIVTETIEEAGRALEEEDGQDYALVMKELRREWELKLIGSGALELGVEVDPSSQKVPLGKGGDPAVKREAAQASGSVKEEDKGKDKDKGKGSNKRGKEEDHIEQRPQKRTKTEGGDGQAASTSTAVVSRANQALTEKNVADIDLADLDDELDELMGGEGDPLVSTKDVVLAQVEKKFKSKNKYRFVFKSGIMQINGLEYVFEKGNGDFKW